MSDEDVMTGSGADDWRAGLRSDLARQLRLRRWDRALWGAAWAHLIGMLACQALYEVRVDSDMRHPLLWAGEFLAVLALARATAGRGWYRASPAIALIVRIWVTFLILSFNLATVNSLMGYDVVWYKPAWATLSSFLFATLAWLFTPRFLLLAVQMYFTGLLIAVSPEWSFAIYGASWWLALAILARTATAQRRLPREDDGGRAQEHSRLRIFSLETDRAASR